MFLRFMPASVLTAILMIVPYRRGLSVSGDGANSYDGGRRGPDMKELLSKRFWQGVVKNFHEGLEGAPPKVTEGQRTERKAGPGGTGGTESARDVEPKREPERAPGQIKNDEP